MSLSQLPFVQTMIIHEITDFITKKWQHPTTIESVKLDWFDRWRLEKVQILDKDSVPLIKADELTLNFSFIELLYNNDHYIHIEDALVDGGSVEMVMDSRLDSMNNMTKWIRHMAGDPKGIHRYDLKDPKDVHIIFEKVRLKNTKYILRNPWVELREKGKFDVNDMEFDNIQGEVTNLRIARDTIGMEIKNLHAFERRSKLEIQDVDTHFAISTTGLILDHLYGKMGSSYIVGKVKFNYDDYTDYNDFFYCVDMDVNLKNSTLHTDDLSLFFTYFDSIHDYISGDVKLQGTVNDLKATKTNLRFGGGSTVRGDFSFDHIIETQRTVMDLQFKDSYYFIEDLEPYVPNQFREYVELFGAVALEGEFKGTLDDFELDGVLNSEYGVITPKMDISIPKETYTGYLKTDSLDVGRVFDVEQVGIVDFEGNVDGKGFDIHSIKLSVDAKMSRLDLNDYSYQNIYLDSTYMKEGYFNGGLRVNDPNLKMFVDGLLNFRDSTFHFKSGILAPDLNTLNLTEKHVGLQTGMEASFDKVIGNGISGGVFFQGTRLYNKKRELNIEELMMLTNVDASGLRLLNIEADFLKFNMAGFFSVTDLSRDVMELINEANIDLFKEDEVVEKYYEEKVKKREKKGENNYSVDADLQITNINDLLSIFSDSIKIADNTRVILSGNFGKQQAFDAKLFSDHLEFYDVLLDSNMLSYHTEKNGYQRQFNTSIKASSGSQTINGVLSEDFEFNAFSVDRNMMFETEVNFTNYKTILQLKGDVELFKDKLIFQLPQSQVKYGEETWTTASTYPSKITVYPDGVEFDNFNLSNNDELLFLNGFLQKDNPKPLHITADNLDLKYLSQYFTQNYEGEVDSLDVYIENVFSDIRVYGHVDVKDLEVDDYFLGDLSGKSQWTKDELNVDFNITDSLSDKFTLLGSYYPNKIEDQLDMKLQVKKLPLGIFQPYVDEVVSVLDGVATGWIKISGKKEAPKLWGNVIAEEGNIRLVFLNVDYLFGEEGESTKIEVRPDKITTTNFKAIDEYGHYAYLNGGVYFDEGFENTVVDLNVRFDDFFIMKKQEEGNDLFYGTAFGTGDISIKGPFDDINIDVTAATNKRTKIYIPLNAIDYSESDPYIVYVKSDSITQDEMEEELDEEEVIENDVANFQVNMNLDITPDAYCELIFDKKSGDIIRGNGEGKLQMKIDKNRNFEMFGNVEIVKGAYNFTMKVAEFNLVDKKFVIDPGSTLSWNGDPYSAQMDIVAKYEQRVSLLPLIDLQDSTIRNAPEITKRYPTDVDLMIKGDLSAPQLGFDIDIHDYPATVATEAGPVSLESYVAGFEERIHRDEQELNRQVFGLIVLRQLLSNDAYTGFGQTASSSVSELLTNQLSYILSQVDENFEVDLDMSGLDKEALQNLQMRLSYTFAQGKVRVTRDGGFTDSQNQTTAASVLGDWTVEVVISQDGALRMKFYQKYRQDVYYTSTNQDNTSLTGASVMHTKSFDAFRDITQSPTKREMTKKPKGYKKYIRKKKREEKKKKKHDEKHTE
ncbi:translocation/assembly module TamB domain-containing protein [Flammeovirga sp. SubArs3]|uniref:translocation/assembly module TamB domain-containing protein n=1 Tax=Flammeovirga sp. SubArs3 TaxID=2995316 RepID=UPI00248B078A|nr:translocation/assembly module TamB domain-containing protein [Flammeovirga sp. SubArs3]